MEVQKIPKRTVTLIEPKKSILVDKEKYHQKRVAAYCRVSTDSEEQLTSYQNQMRVYTEMIAARKEWEFAGLYADEGISGTRADKRPEFQRMIRDCQNGKIDYIITKSVSRFARNTVECLEYVRSLKAQGIGIFFEEQNIDTLKNESELYLVIYAGFAQSESESISKHITWTYRKKFEEGKVSFQYKNFLGYRKGTDSRHIVCMGSCTSPASRGLRPLCAPRRTACPSLQWHSRSRRRRPSVPASKDQVQRYRALCPCRRTPCRFPWQRRTSDPQYNPAFRSYCSQWSAYQGSASRITMMAMRTPTANLMIVGKSSFAAAAAAP